MLNCGLIWGHTKVSLLWILLSNWGSANGGGLECMRNLRTNLICKYRQAYIYHYSHHRPCPHLWRETIEANEVPWLQSVRRHSLSKWCQCQLSICMILRVSASLQLCPGHLCLEEAPPQDHASIGWHVHISESKHFLKFCTLGSSLASPLTPSLLPLSHLVPP